MLRGADAKPYDPYEPDVDNANVGMMTDSPVETGWTACVITNRESL